MAALSGLRADGHAAAAATEPPLVVHVVYRLDVGGLENGVVNLINHMPAQAYRHAVVSLTEVTDFRLRIRREGVPTIALHKPPGHGLRLYPQLWRLFRELRPAVVHTRNLAALEATVPAWLAGVPVRVHGEHGRDGRDLAQTSRRYDFVRRAYRPFVSHYVALTSELSGYLQSGVRVAPGRITQAWNGVDTDRFAPPAAGRGAIAGCPFDDDRHWRVGSVGRMQAVKDPLLLAQAFVLALQLAPALRDRLRLVMVGDGPLRGEAQALLDAAGVGALAWLPGEREDVPEVLRGLDVFVLPSRSEGLSNAILEAMASGLPVIATDVGGNADLVAAGRTGELVPPGDAPALARALVALAGDPARARALGAAGREAALRRFSIQAMAASYQSLYDRLLARPGAASRAGG